jgi:hypothetical protein
MNASFGDTICSQSQSKGRKSSLRILQAWEEGMEEDLLMTKLRMKKFLAIWQKLNQRWRAKKTRQEVHDQTEEDAEESLRIGLS